MSIVIAPGAVDQSIQLRALDSTTFLPFTTIAYDTTGIDMWYQREGAAMVSITEATLAALTTAHADGGLLHKANGYFRLDLPDAAVAAGVDRVYVGGTATGVVMIGEVILLNFITAAGIQTECNDALVANGLDHLVGASVTGTDIADNSIIAKLASKSATADWDSFDNTTDALEANRDNIGTTGAAMTIAAVTGAVGSVTGAVGSVTGAVGSVTGAVGSVTGNVGGNVVGSVASVTGAVGSVTGAVASVTGAVGSVTGLTASDVAAIKAKTDSLTFTVAGKADANITHVIADPVQANSTKETKWGGT